MEQVEQVTDAEGKFNILAWGPKPIPEGLPRRSMLNPMQPMIKLFKPGYRTQALVNEWSGSYLSDPFYKGPSERTSRWDGKTIELAKLPSTVGSEDWPLLVRADLTAVMLRDCNWKKIPKYLSALIRERRRILAIDNRAHVHHLPTLETIEKWTAKERCGSSDTFLR